MTRSDSQISRPHSAVIRTVPRPADSNASGDIFGGWILSQMDIAAGVVAAERARGRVVTVAIDAMRFHRPVYVGDLVSVFAKVTKVGRTSMDIAVETYVHRHRSAEEDLLVTEGTFVFVAIDEHGKPRPVEEASA